MYTVTLTADGSWDHAWRHVGSDLFRHVSVAQQQQREVSQWNDSDQRTLSTRSLNYHNTSSYFQVFNHACVSAAHVHL